MATADPLEGIIGLITTPPFNIIVIAGIIGVIIYFIWTSRKKDENEFEIESFPDTVYQYFEKLMDNFGIETDSFLLRGIEKQGNITKWYPLKQTIFKYRIDPKTKKVTEIKDLVLSKEVRESVMRDGVEAIMEKGVEAATKTGKPGKNATQKDLGIFDSIIFQIGSKSWFSWLTGSKARFVLLERRYLRFDANSKSWGMDENISLIPYANVFIASENAEKFVNNISFMRSQEEVLTYAQNFARKTSWLELAHAKIMDYVSGRDDRKRAGWENYRKRALMMGEDDEDED